jgi:hypothetical protein
VLKAQAEFVEYTNEELNVALKRDGFGFLSKNLI